MSGTSAPDDLGVADGAPRAHLGPGDRLGSYRILARLGEGGMGDVYFAEHVLVGRHVAIKRLHPHYMSDWEVVRRFFLEGKVVNQVKHEHIAEITDFVSDDREAYYVMELLKGRTLRQLLTNEGVLPVYRVCHIAGQLCDVLGDVHLHGFIHRDLKPENVFLIERQRDVDYVKLIDFGIARDVSGEQTAVADIPIGTPCYMAPEQLHDAPIDHRCDIYSLGVVMFQMATGRLPFDAEDNLEVFRQHSTEPPPNPSDFAPKPLPKPFERLILKCLQKQPADRPRLCQDIAEVLQRIRALPEVAAEEPPAGTLTRAPSGAARSPLGAGDGTGLGSGADRQSPEVESAAAARASKLPWIIAAVVLAALGVVGALVLAM